MPSQSTRQQQQQQTSNLLIVKTIKYDYYHPTSIAYLRIHNIFYPSFSPLPTIHEKRERR